MFAVFIRKIFHCLFLYIFHLLVIFHICYCYRLEVKLKVSQPENYCTNKFATSGRNVNNKVIFTEYIHYV